jgi:myosin V
MSEKSYCYIPDESRIQIVCEITKGVDTDEFTVLLLDDEGKKNKGAAETRIIAADKTFPIDSLHEITHPPSDLIQLTNVHGPAILNTLRSRFQQDRIYTSIGPILIACNPFRWIKGVYEKEVIMAYFHGERNQSEHPHVFAMAHDSLMGLQFGKNQSLIISGESGAG